MTRTIRAAAWLCAVLSAAPAMAQETQFEADLRRERDHVAASCGAFDIKTIGGCVYTLATASPFHVALGSLAPQNGFAFGLAFAEHYTPNEAWRLSWNADAVAAPSGAWRSGVYMKVIHTPATAGIAVRPAGSPAPVVSIGPRDFPVLDIVAQTISLQTVSYFGPPERSSQAGRAIYGERQNIIGASAAYPIGGAGRFAALRPALIGGVHGRFVNIRSASDSSVPSLEQIYDEQAAPGLTDQRGFLELREGIRFKPSALNGRLRFNYLVSAQQFRTSRETRASFNRWSLDLQHEIPLYRGGSSTGPRAFNGPDDCAQTTGSPACPPVQWSRNRQGTIALRVLLDASTTSESNRVPFYFQPTLGGSDLNGERLLASYEDYRFRGPDRLAFQESVEHVLWGPIGLYLLAEQGRVANRAGDLGFSGMASSTTLGVTLRAGGFPMVNLSFAWGGEGHHIIGAMNTGLLGGSARPSLY